MTARTPKARIQKGKDLENHVAERISFYGIDQRARRVPGSGNGVKDKRDVSAIVNILDREAGIECKHHTRLDLQDWWRQTKKLETLNYEPVLVYKQTAERYAEAKAVIYLDTLLELVAKANGIGNVVDVVREDKDLEYALDGLKYALKNHKADPENAYKKDKLRYHVDQLQKML